MYFQRQVSSKNAIVQTISWTKRDMLHSPNMSSIVQLLDEVNEIRERAKSMIKDN